MAFSNPVVGGEGGELIRESIKSPDYIPNVQGWSINRDGTAEFNDITVRGDFFIGSPPSPPNAYIHGEVLAGVPTIAIYDGTHVDPARIRGYNIGGSGGLVLDTGNILAENTALALGGNIAELIYENAAGNLEFSFFKVGPPANELLKMRVTSVVSQDLEFGFDIANPTPDLIAGRMYTNGEILMNQLALDANYSMRVVDGKIDSGAAPATVIGTVDTNVSGANMQNIYVDDGWYYIALIQIDYRNNNTGGRIDWKLWDGAVGGSQLGGTCRRWSHVATTTNYEGEMLIFVWRQVGTGIIGNANLSAAKTVVTAGAATAQVNAAFTATVFKCGNANVIQNL